MRMNIDTKLKEIIKRNAIFSTNPDHSINSNTKIVDDFALDSLIIIRILVDCEKEFNIRINEEDLNILGMKDYESLKKYILKKVS